MTASDALWRPLGFGLLMLGLGLRLDTSWQGLAGLLIAAGCVLGGGGLWLLARRRAGAALPTSGAGR
jgi:hypothetical protein